MGTEKGYLEALAYWITGFLPVEHRAYMNMELEEAPYVPCQGYSEEMCGRLYERGVQLGRFPC